MRGHTPRVVLAGKTREDRRSKRAGIRLRDFTVQAKTKARYDAAVGRILPFLEKQPSLVDLDSIVDEWIEAQWIAGEALTYIADCLSGLHFYWPELRGMLRQAWRLFKQWRRIETPKRAPPMTAALAKAYVARAVERNQLRFAAMIAIGFHGLLRTGELMALTFADVEISSTCGVISLDHSKTGWRTGAKEAIAVRDPLTLQLLDVLLSAQPAPGERIWPHSPQKFRADFQRMGEFLHVQCLQMKPYSLRRGGATYLLQAGVPLETILVRGRWRSLAVARLYLEDGMAQLPALRLSADAHALVSYWASEAPPTAFRP